MKRFACTPRGFVFEIYPYTEMVEYYDSADGSDTAVYSEYAMTVERPELIRKHVSRFSQRTASCIELARVDFAFDRAQREVVADVKRMFRNAMGDREALARRAARKR